VRAERPTRTDAVGTGLRLGLVRVAAPLAALLLAGCADPTIQYHRQFEYLRRTGEQALEERRFEDARGQLLEGAKLAKISAATDLEVINTLTSLTRASRELGRLEEAVGHANRAAQVLARYRLAHGGASSGVYREGAAYLLERGRLEIARGDFALAEEALAGFVLVRGPDGGDASESTEAQLLLGELMLANELHAEARALFRDGLDAARGFDRADPVLLGLAAFRVAESKLAVGRGAAAAALVDEARVDDATTPGLRPSENFLRGRIDVLRGDHGRASLRLEDGLTQLAAAEQGVRGASWEDVAAPERAIVLAGALFDPTAPEGLAALKDVVRRALAAAEQGSPLRRMQAGRRVVLTGRTIHAAGAWGPGIDMMETGRDAIDQAVAGRAHAARASADFEIVVAARAGDEEDREAPVLRMALLLRMAAVAHAEGQEAEEQKLFDRVLPLVLPGVYESLEQQLVESYAPIGRFEPSSAAARLAHAAARAPRYAVEAPQLQALAEKLGDEPVPASRRPASPSVD